MGKLSWKSVLHCSPKDVEGVVDVVHDINGVARTCSGVGWVGGSSNDGAPSTAAIEINGPMSTQASHRTNNPTRASQASPAANDGGPELVLFHLPGHAPTYYHWRGLMRVTCPKLQSMHTQVLKFSERKIATCCNMGRCR